MFTVGYYADHPLFIDVFVSEVDLLQSAFPGIDAEKLAEERFLDRIAYERRVLNRSHWLWEIVGISVFMLDATSKAPAKSP